MEVKLLAKEQLETNEVKVMKKIKKNGLNLERQERRFGFLFAIPGMVGFLSFIAVPILFVFYMSFFQVDLMTNTFTFKGLYFYEKMINDDDFWKATSNTILYLIIYVPLTLALG